MHPSPRRTRARYSLAFTRNNDSRPNRLRIAILQGECDIGNRRVAHTLADLVQQRVLVGEAAVGGDGRGRYPA